MTSDPRHTLGKAICALCFCLAPLALHVQRAPKQVKTGDKQATYSIHIHWNGEPGIERYRLQVARDENFADIVFDRPVTGHDYIVPGLPQGNYFWRVAPAIGETGEYSKATPLVVTNKGAAENSSPVIKAPANTGWRTATGEVIWPAPARLRSGGQIDLIGVNTDGTIYALDGASGVALWTARFNPGARRGEKASPVAVFNPVASRRAGETIVIVAFEGGVRALRGETGSELWRTTLTGYAASGTAVGADGDRDTKIAIVTEKPSALYFLDPNNGGVTSRRILEATIIGSPVAFTGKEGGLVALALKGGVLDVRRANGERAHAVKVDVEYTTPPLIVTTPRGTALWIGSEHGLLALNTADLQPIGRIPTEGDMPRGALVAADLHGDGGSDIVIVTQRGRVAVINATDGKIEWVADGATDAASAIFADLNGDGTPDVIVAAGPAFARGFSGRDGTLIWEADEPGAPTKAGDAAASIRFLAITSTASGEAFLAGSDPSRAGIRAVELPKGSVKVAGK